MERKIYLNLSLTASITAILTSFFVSFFILESDNFLHNFLIVLPVTVGILVFILIILNIVSYFLTKNIMKPINDITDNIENIMTHKGSEPIEKTIETYDELKPLLKTIKKQKYEIENYINQLEEMDQYRQDFTANITHELKTPLTSINGFAEMLAAGIVNEEDSIKFGNIIYKEGNRLLTLIDSILNLSAIEMDDTPFELLDIKEIFSEIYPSLNVIGESENIGLNFYVENIVIKGNRRMIKDLLYNLIHNSIKYNKENGSVDIFIQKENSNCLIIVEDTGIGISKEDQDKVFNRFYIAERSRNKNISGTGLGLSIAKHIIEAHHGKVELQSEVDKGTSIKVTLPIK